MWIPSLNFYCILLTFSQNPLGSYGAENVAKIRAAASKYDPTEIFQTRAPGGFKISKVQDVKDDSE
jgi:hypothetical protein